MWEVITTDKFDEWFDCLSDTDRANVIAGMLLLEEKGSNLSRPYADTIEGSDFPNMKELRVQSKGAPLRAFFLLIQKKGLFCYVQEIKLGMRSVFTNE